MNRCARIRSAGHGGQTLLSEAAAEGLPDYALTDLGTHRLRGLSVPERIVQLDGFGAARTFPPLVTTDLLDRLRMVIHIEASPEAPEGRRVEASWSDAESGGIELTVACDDEIVERFQQLTVGGVNDIVETVNASSHLIRVALRDRLGG